MAIKLGMITLTVDTTLDESCELIIVDTTVAGKIITLPLTPQDGTFFFIKDIGNATLNSILIDGNGINIDNATTYTINTDFDYTEVVYCSTNNKWFIL